MAKLHYRDPKILTDFGNIRMTGYFLALRVLNAAKFSCGDGRDRPARPP
jgi:hypothetical protein